MSGSEWSELEKLHVALMLSDDEYGSAMVGVRPLETGEHAKDEDLDDHSS